MALANFTIQQKVTLVTEECITCGICFAIPEEFRANKVRLGGFFCCPVGHSQGWAEGEEERKRKDLQRRLDAKERELESERKRKEWAEQDAKNKGEQLTKLQKRTHAGVCPCCNRTFKQLAAHMKNKHPEVAPKGKGSTLDEKINRRKKTDLVFTP